MPANQVSYAQFNRRHVWGASIVARGSCYAVILDWLSFMRGWKAKDRFRQDLC